MAFGFAGAHRTGKTTLAKLVAEDLKMTFHDASVSKIMREAGINAVGNVPLEARVEAQEFLLRRYLKDLQWAPRPLVTDRTPLDMIGYMLGEITMHNTDAKLGARIQNYVEECLGATLVHFDTIIVVRPLTTYVEDPDKPPMNRAYQTLVQFIVEGAATTCEDAVFVNHIDVEDLARRRELANDILSNRMTELAEQSKAVQRH
jgi:nicotinamide riboside kinase